MAETVMGLLEKRFPGIKNQVEVVDVPTLMTWERYMGGTHGFANMPNKVVMIGKRKGCRETTNRYVKKTETWEK